MKETLKIMVAFAVILLTACDANDIPKEIIDVSNNQYHWQPHYSYMFHCIWGQKENCNGYFRWNSPKKCFDENGYVSKEEDDRGGKGHSAYLVHYYTNFQKNN